MPGMSGAIRIPVGMPARLSSPTAARRVFGWGVCGSLARHAFSSRVGTERFATNSVRAEICLKSSMSRRSSGDFVRTEHGIREVAHRLPDPWHQPVARLDPLIRVRVRPERDVLAAPARLAELGPDQLGHVDLDDDLALEVAARVQVEVGVRWAREAVDPGKTQA